MGSTGEADRKRRHFNSIVPPAATGKKQPQAPLSEEKKHDAAVLQFQNKKLIQKLECQKVEIGNLEGREYHLKDNQKLHEQTLSIVSNSWAKLVDDVESCSNRTMDSLKFGQSCKLQIVKDDDDFPPENVILSRLLETGATESSSINLTTSRDEEDRQVDHENVKTSKKMLNNIVTTFDDLSELKNKLYSASLMALSSNGSIQVGSRHLETDVKNLRIAALKLHLKHRSLAGELQSHRDSDAKNEAELKCLKGELEGTVAELLESNCRLEILKSEKDVGTGSIFPVLSQGSKQVTGDKARSKQRELQDMEMMRKELLDQSLFRLHELKRLHEDRIGILRQLSDLQSKLKDLKYTRSSQAYLLLKDQLEKSKADAIRYQTLYEKLQVDKDSLLWREKESHVKNDLVDILHRSSTVADSRISELETDVQRYTREKDLIETKLKEASDEPGRKEVITNFTSFVSTFPEKMGRLQSELAKLKETASDIHCLRADAQSLTIVLDGKVKELQVLSSRSSQQNSEIQKLQALVHNLKVADSDLKLFLEMYEHESADSRELGEVRISEIKAWAHVQGLKSSLDEHNLESRVKVAIEAEAKSQQRLAATEAEIADLRQKLDTSRREKSRLTDVLKSKNEETEAYISEIETIGQVYDDMQTQNQQLLQQITERDDYNMKLALEGLGARQMEEALLMEKRSLERTLQLTKTTVEIYDFKASRIEDQLKAFSDHIQRLAEDRVHKTSSLENTHKRLSDARKSLEQGMNTMEEAQSEVERSRTFLAELQIELEKERFVRKRVEEDLESLRKKAEQLKQAEGYFIAEKLLQELKEYKEILKCSICQENRKEVVITKCYHLFCNPCVQGIIKSRHRKCPLCTASFGPNDIKPVYI